MPNTSIVPFIQNVDDVIINPLILLVFVLSTAYLFYGVVKFVNPNTGEKDRLEARGAIMWGIVGMAIMFSVYGLIAFVLSTFGVGNGTKLDQTNITNPGSYLKTTNVKTQ